MLSINLLNSPLFNAACTLTDKFCIFNNFSPVNLFADSNKPVKNNKTIVVCFVATFCASDPFCSHF